MSLRINHNIAAINGHRNLLRNDAMIAKSLEKLSSGLKINRAADDAAGLVISEQMRAQITGLNQAIDNTETAISMAQVTEGALDEVNSLLLKARELALHAASDGANDTNQLAADQAEMDNVIESINRISHTTQFGTKLLLDGSLDGASALSAGLQRVNVGNLANNPAIRPGLMTVEVASGAYESNQLNGGGIIDDGFLFSVSGITGVQNVVASTVVNSGVAVNLGIEGQTFSVQVGSGGSTMANVVSALNRQISGAEIAFTAVVSASGGVSVSRSEFSTADFAVTLAFVRASGADNAGVDATSTVTMAPGAGSVATTATAYFGLSDFANLSGSSDFSQPDTVIRYTLASATGVFSASGTASGLAVIGGSNTASIDNVLSGILNAISGVTGMSGATLNLVPVNASSYNIVLDTNNEALSGVTLALQFDYPNVLNGSNAITALSFSGFSAGVANGMFGETAATDIDAATVITTNSQFNITIDGISAGIVLTSGTTLSGVASAMQAELNTTFGAGIYEIAFIESGVVLTGTNFADAGAAALANAALLMRTVNDSNDRLNVTMTWDSALVSGVDAINSGMALATGSISAASFDLVTTAQAQQSGVAAISGRAASTLANVTGLTLNSAGTSGVNATLTTTSGYTLSLTNVFAEPDTVTLGLTAVTGNNGFSDLLLDIDSSILGATGTTTLQFNLENGAVFQVGPNEEQTAGIIIEDTGADELGLRLADSGPLQSLADITSVRQGALINGFIPEAIRVIDGAIDQITQIRGRLGAFQSNTLESNLNSLRVSFENLTNAESTIRDVDFAEESAEFTKNNILVQSATSMLAQANQLPQNVLQLLQ